MLPRESKVVVIEELKPLLKGGSTWLSLFKVMYYTRQYRYIRADQYKLIDPLFSKICTKPKLKTLVDLGYFRGDKVYTATNKVMPVLQKAGFLTRFLPAETEGTGGINALNNTEVFIQALKVENYYTLLFPNFIYLEPDALLIQNYGEKYKLTFLEIESEKFGWDGYLENKRNNYLKLAKDLAFYDFWKTASKILGLRIPTKQELKFNVTFVCSLQRDFGKGFNFKQQI